MPNLTTLTLAQLRAATAAQIVTAITNKLNTLTKRELVEFLLDTIDFSEDPVRTYRADKQVASETVVVRDALGAKTGSRVIAWTYYAPVKGSSPVDTITVRELNASDVEVKKRVIKHYLDGRQPTVTG